MSRLQHHLEQLIAFESITPHDADCQHYIQAHLESLGFECTVMNAPPVSNLFARRGTGSPFLLFAGHTDVVPIGNLEAWDTPPFKLVEKDGYYYGRGVADMKGSVAAMLVMAETLLDEYSTFEGSLGFLFTSGEEGDEFNLGTPFAMEKLIEQGIKPDYCIVGEPSSHQRLGDTLKVGRRGSLTGRLSLQGKQGHVAYPHLADNPIHRFASTLNELTQTIWDEGNDYFSPTSLQVTKIESGGFAGNIIPGELHCHFNLRFSTEQTAEGLIEKITTLLTHHEIQPNIQWIINGHPFLTSQGILLESTLKAIQTITGLLAECSTTGGTSDARFIAPYGIEVLELGPVNQTIHQINECVSKADLIALVQVYQQIARDLLMIIGHND